jgi:curved DNA-binding protein CbpA
MPPADGTRARCTPTAAGRPAGPAGPGRDPGTEFLSPDPYKVLGVRPGVSDEELRAAYRRLVQLHHPDHNNGSPESARRFEEVQEAYAAITGERQRSPRPRPTTPPATDPDVEQRLADLERDMREKARAARERAQRAAREAAASYQRPSDEELGYIKTDDTLGKIVADAGKEFAERLSHAREEPIRDRVADLLDDVAEALKGGRSGADDRAKNQARKRP